MKFRNMAGAFVFWCLVGCLYVGHLQVASADEGTVGQEFMELSEPGSFTPEDLCQSLCGECQCRGLLVSENLCQCSCDFPPDSAGDQNCTMQVRRLCEQMDVQCDFNGPEESLVREPRFCHSMSCYEKHSEHEAGEYDGGHYDGEGYGHDEGHGHGHGGKQFICCKDKKHKEKKHKHKKHKKFHDKHMKFHVVIKGKIPESSCHGGHEGGEHYGGGYDEQEGYRAAMPDKRPNPAHVPMDVSVWTNRQKLPKKHPFRKPFQPHHQKPAPQHYAPAYPAPYPVEPRGKSAEPPASEPMEPPQDSLPPPPQQTPSAPPPPPPEPLSPPVTPFPEHPLTPPPNLYDGAPIGPKKPTPKPKQEPPKTHSFSPPSPPRPPPPPPPPSHYVRPSPPMITVDPPPRRIESSRSFEKPSYSGCEFDSYDFNYYHPPPTYHQPPPPPPPPPATYHRASAPTVSSYRSYSPSYDPSYSSSHYHPHDQYDSPKHYSAYDEPVEHSMYDKSPGDSSEYYREHGVHPFSDNEVEDWPEYPPRHPSDIFTYNQIVSRQIREAEIARLYMTKPFQPTPRPLRDEFEPPTAEVGPVLFESFGPGDKNYEMYPSVTPPPDAFIPPVPPASPPVEFPGPENGPLTFALNSEEALYPQPTPPPHYLLAKETGSMNSFGFEEFDSGPAHYAPASWGYGRSAAGQSHYRSAPSRRSSHSNRSYH
ncbi:uncharacterized protein LOC128304999 [Anopheles moucheti]|uniref:uncharacterized protein LOC128304999 n=1 Tax=Anopheles moucheti TaxID=186751 RepID=UPI0022F0FFBF|nr:uncharacterized protein LOC128304999 [Anopheles moucheti]